MTQIEAIYQNGVFRPLKDVGLPENQRVRLSVQSLAQEAEAAPVSKERREALNKLIGIWKTDKPPSDEEVEQIVEEERMKKYG